MSRIIAGALPEASGPCIQVYQSWVRVAGWHVGSLAGRVDLTSDAIYSVYVYVYLYIHGTHMCTDIYIVYIYTCMLLVSSARFWLRQQGFCALESKQAAMLSCPYTSIHYYVLSVVYEYTHSSVYENNENIQTLQ